MSKIYGEARVIDRANKATPNDKGMYVNMDAIRNLPDEYEAILTEVKFNPKDLEQDFSNVGTDQNPSWMPQPSLMYRIAEARGISGGEVSKSEPIYEDVDISLMNRTDVPTTAKMLVGYRVVKYSTVLEEDGTLRRSSPCSVEYNVYNRCAEAWMKEESYTDGYTKQSQYPPKYDTKFKRRAHFQSELKFAQAKAETKAYEKSIRELAGLMTGYKTEDLKDGSFIFVKIRRSREVLQLETAAKLQAMSHGFNKPEAAPALFGPVAEPEPEPETVIGKPPEKEKTPREKAIEILGKYKAEDLIPTELKDKVDMMIGWLTDNENAEQNKKAWPKVIATLKDLDATVPEFAKENHGLY
jgi:hypothetical protein